MPYQLVFTSPAEGESAEGNKAVGENVFFADLPTDCKVYAFYFSGAMPNPALESKLRDLGQKTGKNLYVNIAGLNDPQLGHVQAKFSIKKYPAIAITALAGLASPAMEHVTTFARLDGEKLFDSPDKTVECVQEVFNLFIQGKVAEAISQAKWAQRKELVAALTRYFTGALKSLGNYIATHDISFALAEGKLDLKKSGA